ncbi:MAG TPA: hypothetical protein VGN42_17355 [Pirellulales bacterium]|jgi:hypothetical protein|nr:hypothetical protein [Pirellulales bacterium]
MKLTLLRHPFRGLFVVVACAAPVAAQWWGYPGYYASTAGEGYALGMAAVVYSAGAANLMNSAAAINVEQARSAYLDNQIKFTETYYAKKRMHQSYVDSTRNLGQSSQRLATLAKTAPPASLSDAELDPVSGQIVWPHVLRGDDYEPLRSKLDELFVERAAAGGNISLQQADAIVDSSDALAAELKKRLKQYPSGDYMRAKRFVEQLSQEAVSL